MLLTVALSLFFGLVAGFALFVCTVSAVRGMAHARAIKAELDLIDRAFAPVSAQPRRRQAAFA